MFPLSNIIPLPTHQEFLRRKDLRVPFFPLINMGKIEVKRKDEVMYSQEVIEHFMNPKKWVKSQMPMELKERETLLAEI